MRASPQQNFSFGLFRSNIQTEDLTPTDPDLHRSSFSARSRPPTSVQHGTKFIMDEFSVLVFVLTAQRFLKVLCEKCSTHKP